MFCALVFFERKARTRGASVAAFFAGAACFFAVELGWCKYFVEAIDPSYPCFLFYASGTCSPAAHRRLGPAVAGGQQP